MCTIRSYIQESKLLQKTYFIHWFSRPGRSTPRTFSHIPVFTPVDLTSWFPADTDEAQMREKKPINIKLSLMWLLSPNSLALASRLSSKPSSLITVLQSSFSENCAANMRKHWDADIPESGIKNRIIGCVNVWPKLFTKGSPGGLQHPVGWSEYHDHLYDLQRMLEIRNYAVSCSCLWQNALMVLENRPMETRITKYSQSISSSLRAQRIKPWRWWAAAKDHTRCHSCQLSNCNCGDNLFARSGIISTNWASIKTTAWVSFLSSPLWPQWTNLLWLNFSVMKIRSVANIWGVYINMEQNLGGIFPALSWITVEWVLASVCPASLPSTQLSLDLRGNVVWLLELSLHYCSLYNVHWGDCFCDLPLYF